MALHITRGNTAPRSMLFKKRKMGYSFWLMFLPFGWTIYSSTPQVHKGLNTLNGR